MIVLCNTATVKGKKNIFIQKPNIFFVFALVIFITRFHVMWQTLFTKTGPIVIPQGSSGSKLMQHEPSNISVLGVEGRGIVCTSWQTDEMN